MTTLYDIQKTSVINFDFFLKDYSIQSRYGIIFTK